MTYDQLVSALALTQDLERDLGAHTSYFFEVARGLARAENNAEELKSALAHTEAALQLEMRQAVAQAGEKVTEAGIIARIQLTEEFQKATVDHLNARAQVREWLALKESFEARGYCMNNLTALQTRGMSSAGITNQQYQDLRKQQTAVRAPLRPRV